MADRYELRWIDHTGHVWNITSLGWVAGIRAGGIDGLMGAPDDVAVTTPGVPGQVLDSQDLPAMVGTLSFAVRGDGNRTADDVWADLRQSFHHKIYGTLILRVPTLGNLSAEIRRGGKIPAPSVDTASEEVILGADVPVTSDDACWWTDWSIRTGIVTVTNIGDVDVWVKIRWVGDGGRVTVPSGASFTLPAVTSPRTLFLNTQESMVVEDDDGNVDTELWKQLRGGFPEMVPAGESRIFTLPPGAEIHYRLGVLDPWK